MVLYLLRRLSASLLLILALLSAVFFLVRLVPGDPIDRFTGADIGAEERALIRHSYGLDRPLLVQYRDWIGGVLVSGDWGQSLRQHRPVAAVIGEAIGPTLLLTLTAYVVHLLIAVAAGVLMARHRGRRGERIATVGGLALYSVPAFWLGQMLILVFCLRLGWLPASGMTSPDAAFLPWPARLWDLVRHLLLPVCLLGVASAMGTARYLRNSLAEVLAQDYILAARAHGLPERVVQWKHALRNALLPVVTLAGLSLPFLLGGAVMTEVVFAWPGMGRVTVEAIFARDYPVVMGTTALAAVLVVAGNLIADLLYGVVDPRVRLRGEGTA
jgi:peptide/nickel transport system permease protein